MKLCIINNYKDIERSTHTHIRKNIRWLVKKNPKRKGTGYLRQMHAFNLDKSNQWCPAGLSLGAAAIPDIFKGLIYVNDFQRTGVIPENICGYHK